LGLARQRLIDYTHQFHRALTQGMTGGLSPSYLQSFHGNMSLMYCGALGTAAIALMPGSAPLPTDSAYFRPELWLSTALHYLEEGLWQHPNRQSEPDALAGFAEGPYYLQYAGLCIVPFLRGLQQFLPQDSIDYQLNGNQYRVCQPLRDPRWHRLLEWHWGIALPYGYLPPYENSFGYFTVILAGTAGLSVWAPEVLIAGNPAFQRAARDLVDISPYYIGGNVEHQPQTSTPETFFAPAAGNVVFRSGRTLRDLYFHALAEEGRPRQHGGGHDHADNTSFVLYRGHTPLALDPGYIGWNDRHLVNGPAHHNLVLIDNCGPQPPTAVESRDVNARLSGLVELPGLRWVDAAAAYCNGAVDRRFVLLRDSILLVHDKIRAPGERIYTFQLHGNAPDSLFAHQPTQHRAHWAVDSSAQLTAHILGLGTGRTTYATRQNVHEILYGLNGTHTTWLVRQTSQDSGGFLALVQPQAAQATPVEVERLAGEAVGFAMGERLYAWHSPNQSFASPGGRFAIPRAAASTAPPSQPDSLWANAQAAMVELDAADEVRTAWIEAGQTLLRNHRPLLHSNQPGDAAWVRTAPDSLWVWANQSAPLRLWLWGEPHWAGGATLDSLAWDPQRREATLGLRANQAVLLYISALTPDSIFYPWVLDSLPPDTIPDSIPDTRSSDLLGALSVYPNPSSGDVSIDLPDLRGQLLSLFLLNPMGQLIESNVLAATPARLVLHLPGPGLYLLQLESGPNRRTEKLVVY
jgi:hypothetical protein